MAVKPVVKTFEYFFDRLLRGFKKDQGREPNNLEMILIRQEAGNKAKDANKIIQFPYKRSFGEELDDMISKGEINVGEAPKTQPYEKSQSQIEFEIMERLNKQNEDAIKAFESRNPNKKPRDEKYTGGMVDVEPNLSDIGHGSDALMARTRLVAPNSQATTSTGLNYLLAEDNDNIRIPFSKGKIAKEIVDKGRRGFMKAAGTAGAGIAALKTGLIGLGEKAAPVVEKAVETAKGVPPYFFQLVDVIKSKGQEIKSYGERIKQYIAPSKDGKSELMLTEDLNTGDIQVKKIYKENDDMVTKTEEMNFNKGQADEGTKGTPPDDYEEVTSYNSRIYKDEFNEPDFVEGIDVEEIVKEIDVKKADGGRIGYSKGKTVMGFLEIIKNPKKIREAIDNIFKTGDYKMDAELAAESLVELNPKAFGGKLYDDLDDKTRMEVYGAVINDVMGDVSKTIKEKKTSTYKFLEKVFGKENMSEMQNRDPEMYKGMMEVVPMFRKKDKEGLKMYMQKYLPHMDDETVEAFIRGDAADAAGQGKFGLDNMQGQLIRLGSGRDYKGKIEAMKKLENNQKLQNFDIKDRKPNALGGIQTMLGE